MAEDNGPQLIVESMKEAVLATVPQTTLGRMRRIEFDGVLHVEQEQLL